MFDLNNGDIKLLEIFTSEKDYRSYEANNQSKLKDWVNLSPFKWRNRYITKTDVFEPSPEMLMGTALDILITGSKKEFEGSVYVSKLESIPTGNSLKLVDALFEIYEKRDDVVTFDDDKFFYLFNRAYDAAGIKSPKKEVWIENFLEHDNVAQVYFLEKLATKDGKVIISQQGLQDTLETEAVLKAHPISKPICDNRDMDIEVLTQFGIAFEYKGVKYKALYDFLKIDHRSKTIWGIDLKTNYSPNEFGTIGYLKNRYYFQDGIYSKGLEALLSSDKFKGYVLHEDVFSFLVIDNKGVFDPSLWTITHSDGNAWDGFTTKWGSKYKGIHEVVEEIDWHTETGNFKTTKQLHDNNNHIRLEL